MKLGITISTNDAEIVWNAFRLANYSKGKGDLVKVFLLANGVEYESTSNEKFNGVIEAKNFLQAGGEIMACGTCLKLRQSEGSNVCPISTLANWYSMIFECDKLVTL